MELKIKKISSLEKVRKFDENYKAAEDKVKLLSGDTSLASKAFLHWGYNFYNARRSLYPVNPLLTSSCDGGFPSGDAFSVYPYGNEALPSLRAIVFKDALQDVRLMKLAESFIGKDEVIKLAETMSNHKVSFSHCPRDINFYDKFTKELKEIIEKHLS